MKRSFHCHPPHVIFHPLATKSLEPKPPTNSGPIGLWKKAESCCLTELSGFLMFVLALFFLVSGRTIRCCVLMYGYRLGFAAEF